VQWTGICSTLATVQKEPPSRFQIAWKLFQTLLELCKRDGSRRRVIICFYGPRIETYSEYQAFNIVSAFPEDALVRTKPSGGISKKRSSTNQRQHFLPIFQHYCRGSNEDGKIPALLGNIRTINFSILSHWRCHRGEAMTKQLRGILKFSPAVPIGLRLHQKDDNVDT